MRKIAEILIILLLGFFLIAEGDFLKPLPPAELKNYFVEKGVKQTGAINLVSSIYLTYRAFDTLGETIVLLLAVSGVIMLFEARK